MVRTDADKLKIQRFVHMRPFVCVCDVQTRSMGVAVVDTLVLQPKASTTAREKATKHTLRHRKTCGGFLLEFRTDVSMTLVNTKLL